MSTTTITTPDLNNAPDLDTEFPEVQIDSSSIEERARATFAKSHNRRVMFTFEEIFADDKH